MLGARGDFAMEEADARFAECNEIRVERGCGFGEGCTDTGQETNLNNSSSQCARKPSASAEISAVLHKFIMLLCDVNT